MRRRARLLLTITATALALAALIVFGLASSGSTSARKAPALPREQLAGPPTTLAGLLAGAHGRATLVTFWASWCGPCAREAPALERFARSAAGSGRLVAVDWSDARSPARAFIAQHGWTFPVLRDGEGTVGNEYRITGLPTTFVLDSSGRIRTVLRGPQTASSLAHALAGASSA